MKDLNKRYKVGNKEIPFANGKPKRQRKVKGSVGEENEEKE